MASLGNFNIISSSNWIQWVRQEIFVDGNMFILKNNVLIQIGKILVMVKCLFLTRQAYSAHSKLTIHIPYLHKSIGLNLVIEFIWLWKPLRNFVIVSSYLSYMKIVQSHLHWRIVNILLFFEKKFYILNYAETNTVICEPIVPFIYKLCIALHWINLFKWDFDVNLFTHTVHSLLMSCSHCLGTLEPL